jgi:hypothetical protein
MVKFVAPLVVAAAVLGFAPAASADSFTLQQGFSDGVAITNGDYGFIGIGTIGFPPDYLEGWTFLLAPGTDYTGSADDGNVNDILHFSADGAEVWSSGYAGVAGDGSNMTFGATFAAVLSSALAANKAQVVGDPLFPGARGFDPTIPGPCPATTPGPRCVGLSNEDAAGNSAALEVAFGAAGSGGNDLITLGGAAATVPEPATLTLLGIGGAVAAYRRRRKAA